eukprot:7387155-Prymnesium_polylepis.1
MLMLVGSRDNSCMNNSNNLEQQQQRYSRVADAADAATVRAVANRSRHGAEAKRRGRLHGRQRATQEGQQLQGGPGTHLQPAVAQQGRAASRRARGDSASGARRG